ncbi:hypothetical protein [Pseudomonas coleopterorum]|uniref:hypothetical protein n=1 Tax=Pseudomonas coleopterorum TaxID=1605838 RepID=UPI0011142402|nr:hypothetical protein [Pseudomonas coleopterorum]
MIKQAQSKPVRPTGKKESLLDRKGDRSISTRALRADNIVERAATKGVAGSALSQSLDAKIRSGRAPQLSTVERQLNELRKVVEALAIRSVAQERSEHSFDEQGILVLDAKTAYQLLDNPPEPTDTLRNILALH